MVARRVIRLDELLIEEKPLNDVPRDASAAAMLDGVRSLGLDALALGRRRARLPGALRVRAHARSQGSGRLAGRSRARRWRRISAGSSRFSTASRAARNSRACQLLDALRARLTYEQQRKLDELAPTHIGLPTGSRARIDYLDDNAPVASMRMQEVFGLAATPRIGGGTVPVTFKLLSPGRSPLQVTRDLASFWRNAYVEVRKDMRGRYPRHYWPENPLEAEPTRRAKPRA